MFLKWGMIFLRALIRIHHYKGLRTTQLIKILQLQSFIFVFHPKTFSKFVALNHNKMHRWGNHTNQPYNLINTLQAVLLIPFFFVIVTWIKTTRFQVDWEDLQLVSDPWDIAFSQGLGTNKWQEHRGHEPNEYKIVHENSTTFGRLIFLDLRTQLTNSNSLSESRPNYHFCIKFFYDALPPQKLRQITSQTRNNGTATSYQIQGIPSADCPSHISPN